MFHRNTLFILKSLSKNVNSSKLSSCFRLTSGPINSFSDKINFDWISSYDSLNQRIHNSGSIEETLSILDTTNSVLRTENAAMGLKSIARNFRANNYMHFENLNQDKRFKDVIEKITSNISDLSESAAIDVLFFMRKGIKILKKLEISGQHTTNVIDKINEHIKEGKYNFNQLVNIHYDVSILGRKQDIV